MSVPDSLHQITLDEVKTLRDEMAKARKSIGDMVDIQCQDGTWNFDPYMLGLANGLLLAKSILSGEEPKLLSKPEKWKTMDPGTLPTFQPEAFESKSGEGVE